MWKKANHYKISKFWSTFGKVMFWVWIVLVAARAIYRSINGNVNVTKYGEPHRDRAGNLIIDEYNKRNFPELLANINRR